MKKAQIGISVGMLRAAIYFVAMFGGYIPLLLMAGYVLLMEENTWLRVAAIKACIIMFTFSFLYEVVCFVPDITELLHDIFSIFGKSIGTYVLDNIVTLIQDGLLFIRKILFLLMGIKALHQGTVSIGFVNKMLQKHTQE